MLPAYAELHCLSNFSFLRGASHPEELVERAVTLGYAALAITDECSVSGAVRAHLAAQDAGLPLVIGSELTLADGMKLVLLATDRASYGNLTQLITRGRRQAKKGAYVLSRDDVAAFAGGLLALGSDSTFRGALPGTQATEEKSSLRTGSPRPSAAARGSLSSFSPAPATLRGSRVTPSCRRRAGCRRWLPATSTCMSARGARCRIRSPRSA